MILKATIRERGQTVILSLSGKLVFQTRKEYQKAIQEVRGKSPRKVLMNLKEVSYLDSAGLGLLALTFEQENIDNIAFGLVGPQGAVKKILEMTHIPTLIPVYESEEEAMGQRLAPLAL